MSERVRFWLLLVTLSASLALARYVTVTANYTLAPVVNTPHHAAHRNLQPPTAVPWLFKR